MSCTLQEKDFICYLPHDLMGWHEDGHLCNITLESYVKHGLCNYKPILRNMSDLTKPITHKGETFVPIVELAKIAFPHFTWRLGTIAENGYIGGFAYSEGTKSYFSYENKSFRYAEYLKGAIYKPINTIPLVAKLHDWMFDMNGLIDVGSAIDVNTLDNNVYA